MPNSSVGFTAGTGTNTDTWQAGDGDHRQYVIRGEKSLQHFRSSTFIQPHTGNTGSIVCGSFFNSGGVVAQVSSIEIDYFKTAVFSPTTPPYIFKVARVYTEPTGGTAYTKVSIGNTGTSNSGVVFKSRATSDGVNGTTLSVPSTSEILTQECSSRNFSTAHYETADRVVFFKNITRGIVVNPNEGLVVLVLDPAVQPSQSGSTATTIEWIEY